MQIDIVLIPSLFKAGVVIQFSLFQLSEKKYVLVNKTFGTLIHLEKSFLRFYVCVRVRALIKKNIVN